MNADNKIFDRFSVMIIGDEKVGKSSLIERFNFIFKLKDTLIGNTTMKEKEL